MEQGSALMEQLSPREREARHCSPCRLSCCEASLPPPTPVLLLCIHISRGGRRGPPGPTGTGTLDISPGSMRLLSHPVALVQADPNSNQYHPHALGT